MSTRFYFPVDTEAPASPAFGAWGYTTEALRRLLAKTKGSSAITIGSQIGPWTATAGFTALDRQYVSDPIAQQTISGTVAMQLMVREYATQDNVDRLLLLIKVVSGDGGTLRGTLLALGNYGPTLEFISNATHRNKTGANGQALTSVNAEAGDRIVIEIGYTCSGSCATPEASAKYGENADDLPVNETQTTNGAGWIEFSANIAWPAVTYTYSGNVPLAAIPAHTSAVDRIYAGAVPISCLPSCQSSLEKGYQGDVAMTLIPAHLSAMEKGYEGSADMALSPSCLSILDRAYQGQVDMSLSPAHILVMDRLYGGDVPLGILPGYQTTLDKGYEGAVALGLLPSHSSVVDRVYGGDAGLSLLPAHIAALEKGYDGAVAIVLIPSAIYSLEGGRGGEFVYLGDIPLTIMPDYTLVMDRVYDGQVSLALVPAHGLILDRTYLGDGKTLALLPGSLYKLLGPEIEEQVLAEIEEPLIPRFRPGYVPLHGTPMRGGLSGTPKRDILHGTPKRSR